MGSLPQSPTQIRARNRDTGFPEPFCGDRNTRLPHPDADLSPGACISPDNAATQRLQSRHRRTFLIRHKHATSHGMITPEMERQYSDLSLLEEDEPLATLDSRPSRPSTRSKDSSDHITSTNASGHRRSSVLQLDNMERSPRRRSFFRKLIHH